MGVHDGHRERMRSQFLESGLDSFNELNALELLLFYAIPRKNTNEIAHALLNRFGSLDGIFAASEQELCDVPGIGENAAALLLLVPQVMRKAEISKTSSVRSIHKVKEAAAYLIPRFLNEHNEVIRIVCLDSQMRIINCLEVGRGVVNAVRSDIRRIVELAMKSKASYVILAHNHPDGLPQPSVEDDAVTKQIMNALALMGIELWDHIVIAGDRYASYRQGGYLGLYKY